MLLNTLQSTTMVSACWVPGTNKTIFPWMGGVGVGMVAGMIQAHYICVHFISFIMISDPASRSSSIRPQKQEFGAPRVDDEGEGSRWGCR